MELYLLDHRLSSQSNNSNNFESFKAELTKMLNIIIDDHNVKKEELYKTRKDNHDKMSKIEDSLSRIKDTVSSLVSSPSPQTLISPPSAHVSTPSSQTPCSPPRPTGMG